MLQKIKLLIVIGFGLMPLALASSSASVLADCTNPQTTQDQIQCGVNEASSDKGKTADAPKTISDTLKTVLNVLSAAAGLAAVVMLVVAGIRFSASAGNENAVKGAKNAVIYAVIGLVIVALAQLLVHFVISTISGASP